MAKKPGPKIKANKEQFTQSLVKHQYCVLDVMADLNISRESFYRYIKTYDLLQFVEEGEHAKRRSMVSLAEHKLLDAIHKGKQWAIAFTLARLAKDIYSEKVINENTNTDIKVIKPKPPKKD